MINTRFPLVFFNLNWKTQIVCFKFRSYFKFIVYKWLLTQYPLPYLIPRKTKWRLYRFVTWTIQNYIELKEYCNKPAIPYISLNNECVLLTAYQAKQQDIPIGIAESESVNNEYIKIRMGGLRN